MGGGRLAFAVCDLKIIDCVPSLTISFNVKLLAVSENDKCSRTHHLQVNSVQKKMVKSFPENLPTSEM